MNLAWLKGLGLAIVDLLFPPRCVACHRLGAWLCAKCLAEIDTIRPPVCQRCGLPLNEHYASPPAGSPSIGESLGGALICDRCERQPSPLDGIRACAFHDGALRKAIHQFKYQDLRSLAGPLGKLMSQSWAEFFPTNHDIDVITPVPLHAARQRERGYNQAALLARKLGYDIQRPVVEDTLVRAKPTLPQINLTAQERRNNVRGAFQTVNSSLAGKRVLLVDDVYTTGSTLEAACQALRANDAASVWAYTLARARPGPRPSLE